jgi:hypothetical protein
MTFPIIVDVVIGTAYAYLFFSLLVSGLNELWARFTNKRAKALESAIPVLLGSTPNPGAQANTKVSAQASAGPLAAAFSTHPLIRGLATDYRFPSYIPSAHLALALIDVGIDLANARPKEKVGSTEKALNEDEKRLLTALISQESNVRIIQARIEKWFTDSTPRISGMYKRATSWSLALIALAISFLFGFDSIRLVNELYSDPVARQVAVGAAKNATAQSAPMPQIPIGWGECHWDDKFFYLGCLISAVAITFGAPFWFDVLNLFVNMRQTGKPPPTGQSFSG